MSEQLALDSLYGCDACNGTGIETNPETLEERSCRVCYGSGTLDYDPAGCDVDPFHGLGEVA